MWVGGGTGSKKTKNLPALKDHLHAKFHPDPSSGLDFYREYTHIDRHCPFLVDFRFSL